jgi:hypothetical protein
MCGAGGNLCGAGGNLCGAGGNLYGAGAPGGPGAGADRSPITLICRWQHVWGRCTRWARSGGQTDYLLHCLPATGGNLCGAGAPGGSRAGANRSPITMLSFRWQPVWGRCTRWVKSRCKQILYYNVFLQVATCVGQVRQVGQEQVQIDLLLHCLPTGGIL